jgi:heat-inducible transcriptional repressor
LSAATVRNVMADLEEYGFVTSPHTSAGRVPTDKGYRFFVDSLLRRRPEAAADEVINELRRSLEDEEVRDPKAIVAVASQMLSSITHLAGVVTIPRQPHQALSQIEFLPLSDNRVLAVMVVNGRDVQNRIVQLDRYYSADELRRAANFLNQQFGGKELRRVREDLVTELKQTGERLNQLMLDAIRVAQQMVGEGTKDAPEYVIADCSLVTAPYTLDNQTVGVLGVIGPTRMAYERVIPIVDVTARLLGSALNSRR